MRKSLSKKSKKVIEKGLEELKQGSSLAELTRIGARVMLQVAVEEELRAFLGRDYYERRTDQEGSRSGSKPRTIKIGGGDIGINMSMVGDAGGPFHSLILSPRVAQTDGRDTGCYSSAIHEWVVFKESEEVSGKTFRQEGT